MGDDIGDITLKQIVGQAANDNDAFDSLIAYPTVKQHLDKISAWAEYKYKQNRAEIRGAIVLKLWQNIRTIHNPDGLGSWFYKAARSYCLNEIRDRKKEWENFDEIGYECYGSQKRGGHLQTPEQKVLDKEQTLQLEEAVRRASAKFPKWLVDLWALGKSPQEIIRETGKPSATIYRMLKKLQRTIMEEFNSGSPVQPNND